ncbi:MAG: IclR family transcriptional regulator [Actinomycetota bacterium]
MKSVRNALRVLDELAADGPLGVGELARRTDIAKSTVQRCLETLAEEGWIDVAFDGGPGAVTQWAVADRIRQRLSGEPVDLLVVADPVMRELTALTGEATHLVGFDGSEVVLRHRVAEPGPVQIVLPIGYAVPAHASATGKAMLAMLAPDDRRTRLPAGLAGLTEATITDAATFDAELDRIRAQGWASNVGEWHAQVAAVAAPVMIARHPIAALSVSATPERLPADRLAPVGEQVVEAAARIGRLLGGRLDVERGSAR